MQSRKKLREGKIVEKDRDIGINSSSGWSELLNSYDITFSVTKFLITLYISFSQLWRNSFPLYYPGCILALQLDNHYSSLGCLSHQGLAGGGRICCKLWRHFSGVILTLMWPAKLVQCNECEGDGYFTWKLPRFFTCTSLLPSLALGICGLDGHSLVSQRVLVPQVPRAYRTPQFLK